jgi:hypothetical protein
MKTRKQYLYRERLLSWMKCYLGLADTFTITESSMTIEEAAVIIYDVAAFQGAPLPMDVCRQIAMKLFFPHHQPQRPGNVAKHHRQRYEE